MESIKKKRVPYAQARIETIALEAEVQVLIKKGYTLKYIFEEFTKQGKISMAYSTLCRSLRKYSHNKYKKVLINEETNTSTARKTRIISEKPTSFGDASQNLEDLIG